MLNIILSISLVFNTSFDSQIREKCNTLKDIKSFVSYIKENNFTDEQKVRASTLFTCFKLEYPKYLNTHQLSKDPNVILSTKVGVCYEYSILFKALCDSLNIRCEIIQGITNEHYHYYLVTKKLGYLHAWNIVYIDNTPYLIDVTWCDGKIKIDEQWYLSDPSDFILTHYPLGTGVMILEYNLLPRFEYIYHCSYLQVINKCQDFKDECKNNFKYQLLNKPILFKKFNNIK